MRIHIHISVYIAVYYAYIVPHIAYTYHSAGLLYHIQAHISAHTPTVYAVPLTSAGAWTRYARSCPKKCGYRRGLYAPYMVYFPHPTIQKHKKITP